MATSREFMAATGGSQIGPIEVPTDLRHLLITAVLTCRPGPVVVRFFANNNRNVSDRTVAGWLQATRKWLGIPPATRGKISKHYRHELEKWHQANGHPTPEEIDAGWVPLHRRGTTRTDDDRSKSKSPEAEPHSPRALNSQAVDLLTDGKAVEALIPCDRKVHRMSPRMAAEFAEFRDMLADLDEAKDDDDLAQCLERMLAKLRDSRR